MKIKNMTTLHLRKSIDRSPWRCGYLLIAVTLAFGSCILAGSSLAGGPKVDRWGNPSSGNEPGLGFPTPIVEEYAGPDTLSLISDPAGETIFSDPAGDQVPGPSYGDCRKAGVTNSGPVTMTVGQKINGTFPPTPPGDVAAYSWRFDTDLNPNTGYQQYPYIGIEWEILILDGGGFWSVNKWSPSTGYLPVPSAIVSVSHRATGDLVRVSFNLSEIGSPVHANWIVWNGYFPTWFDIAPDTTVAFWGH
jgi:hypothetical protein